MNFVTLRIPSDSILPIVTTVHSELQQQQQQQQPLTRRCTT